MFGRWGLKFPKNGGKTGKKQETEDQTCNKCRFSFLLFLWFSEYLVEIKSPTGCVIFLNGARRCFCTQVWANSVFKSKNLNIWKENENNNFLLISSQFYKRCGIFHCQNRGDKCLTRQEVAPPPLSFYMSQIQKKKNTRKEKQKKKQTCCICSLLQLLLRNFSFSNCRKTQSSRPKVRSCSLWGLLLAKSGGQQFQISIPKVAPMIGEAAWRVS